MTARRDLMALADTRISALPRRVIYVSNPSTQAGGNRITSAAGPFCVSTAEPVGSSGAGNVDHGAQPQISDMFSGDCRPGVRSFHVNPYSQGCQQDHV